MEILKIFLVLGAVIIIFAFICLLVYAPVFLNRYRAKVDKRTLDSEIEKLNSVYERSRLVITRPLGQGGSKNSGIKFAEAHKNRDLAVKSVRSLIADMKIMRD